MHPDVISDRAGECPKCGMDLERSTPISPFAGTVYTCPMHPEVEESSPGDCPLCGMPLEAKGVTDGIEAEDDSEMRSLRQKLWQR